MKMDFIWQNLSNKLKGTLKHFVSIQTLKSLVFYINFPANDIVVRTDL